MMERGEGKKIVDVWEEFEKRLAKVEDACYNHIPGQLKGIKQKTNWILALVGATLGILGVGLAIIGIIVSLG